MTYISCANITSGDGGFLWKMGTRYHEGAGVEKSDKIARGYWRTALGKHADRFQNELEAICNEDKRGYSFESRKKIADYLYYEDREFPAQLPLAIMNELYEKGDNCFLKEIAYDLNHNTNFFEELDSEPRDIDRFIRRCFISLNDDQPPSRDFFKKVKVSLIENYCCEGKYGDPSYDERIIPIALEIGNSRSKEALKGIAKRGNPEALWALYKRDPVGKKALHYLEKAKNKGHIEAMKKLYEITCARGDRTGYRCSLFKAAVQFNDPEAQNRIGATCAKLADESPLAEKLARIFFEAAAEKNNAEAVYNLGLFSEKDDSKRAEAMYMKARELGHEEASFRLAQLVEGRNKRRASQLYKEYAEKAHSKRTKGT